MQKERVIKVRRVNWTDTDSGQVYDTTKVDILKRVSRTDANSFGYDVITALVGDSSHYEKWMSVEKQLLENVFVNVEMTLDSEIKGNGKALDWFVDDYRIPNAPQAIQSPAKKD